jgi:hypothetical protein
VPGNVTFRHERYRYSIRGQSSKSEYALASLGCTLVKMKNEIFIGDFLLLMRKFLPISRTKFVSYL